jgi:RimJ/RimL family protein N-acetyltransferase
MEVEDTAAMTSPDLPIETDRLTIRCFEKSDLEPVLAYYGLPEVQRYLDWKARDKVEVKAALDAMCAQRRLNRPGDMITLAVARRNDDTVMGQVSLRWTDATAGQAELRFVFNPLYRRQGYASEAVKATLDLGFDHFGFHRVFARCGADNQRSARLLKRIGMRLEAHYREHALFQGEWDEELHFAILDREWQRGTKVKEITRHMVA